WPALLVAGGSFAAFQLTFATIHEDFPGIVLYPMTDIGGGIFSLGLTAIFLKFWKPKELLLFTPGEGTRSSAAPDRTVEEKPRALGRVSLAWTPYALMSVLLFLTGLVRQKEVPVKEGPGPVHVVGPLYTNYQLAVPALHQQVQRDEQLHDPSKGT